MNSLLSDPLLLGTIGAICVWILLVALVRPTFAVHVVFLSFLITATLWGAAFGGGADPRPLAGMALLSILIYSLLHPAQNRLSSRQHAFVSASFVFAAYNLMSTFWSRNPSETLGSGVAWVLLVLLIWWIVRSPSGTRNAVVRAALTWLWVLVGLSAISLVVGYPEPWRGERAQGISNNPNGLAIVTMMIVPLTLAGARKWSRYAVFVPLVLCVLSGSRAGAVGLLLGLAVYAWRVLSARGRIMVAPIVAIGAYYAIGLIQSAAQSGPAESPALLRSNDSRADVWGLAIDAFHESPWVGIGAGALPTESGSSYLKTLSELGGVGFVLAMVLIVTAIRLSWESVATNAVLLGCMAEGAFEGWLFTAGSAYTVILFSLVASAVSLDSGRDWPDAKSRERHREKRRAWANV